MNNPHLDRHRTRIGVDRKEALKHLKRAQSYFSKCRNEREELQVFRALMEATEDIAGTSPGRGSEQSRPRIFDMNRERYITHHFSPYRSWQGPESETPEIVIRHREGQERLKVEARGSDDSPTVRCNNCMAEWHEDELQRRNCAVDGGRCDACPACGTDHHLMDIGPHERSTHGQHA